MIDEDSCIHCIHKNVCRLSDTYHLEIERLKKENKNRSFITVVRCDNFDTIGNIILKYRNIIKTIPSNIIDHDEAQKILSNVPYPPHAYSGFHYDCYFKSDLEESEMNDGN